MNPTFATFCQEYSSVIHQIGFLENLPQEHRQPGYDERLAALRTYKSTLRDALRLELEADDVKAE